MSLGNAVRAPQDSLRPEDNFILWLNAACRFPSKNGGGEKKIRGKNTFHNKSTGELRHNGSIVKMFALMAQRGSDLNLPKLTFVSRRYANGQMLLFEIEFWVPRIGHWHLRVHFLKLKHMIWSDCSVCQSALMSHSLLVGNETRRLFMALGDI